ncbi:MAG TPA: hypothetical protein VMT74_04985 [Gaiellaceae bacterium]|nr:hypothetical protein [Gaiellaceae bacterium]
MTLPYRIVVRHDDALDEDYVEVEFLEPEHATFQDFINHDVFGRWGLEDLLSHIGE